MTDLDELERRKNCEFDGEATLDNHELDDLIAKARRLERLEAMLHELYPFNGAPQVEEQLREVIDQSCAFAEAHLHVERLLSALRSTEQRIELLRGTGGVPFPLREDIRRIHEDLIEALGGKP